MSIQTKRYTGPLQVKSASKGTISCVFATMGVWDHDNDYTRPGAFGEQQVIFEGWNHSDGLPCGEGRIYEKGNDAIFDGFFYMDTVNGRDHFAVVQKRADRQQFSYTFDIEQSKSTIHNGKHGRYLEKLTVLGVSPVLRGAGFDTRVLSIKGRTWLPIGNPKAVLLAKIDEIETRLRHIEMAELEAMLQKDAPEPTTQQMVEDVWYTLGEAQGHSRAYLDFVLAARREWAWMDAQHFQYHYVPCWPECRD